MTQEDVEDQVARKFGLDSSSGFSTDLYWCIEAALNLMASYISKPKDVDISQSLADSETTLDYADTVSRIFWRSANADHWTITTDWYQADGVIYFTEHLGAVDLKILSEIPYDVTNIDTMPWKYTPVLLDFTCSEFASLMAGAKSRYSVYMQTNSARGVDNMMELADFYENRANQRIRQIADASGLL